MLQFRNNVEVIFDILSVQMVQAIQVLRFHLLEIEKVSDLMYLCTCHVSCMFCKVSNTFLIQSKGLNIFPLLYP